MNVPKTGSSQLRRVDKSNPLYKEYLKVKKEVKDKGIKIRCIKGKDGLYHAIGRDRMIIGTGTTEKIAIENAMLLQARGQMSERSWKAELSGWDSKKGY
jgi:hypothetical protein